MDTKHLVTFINYAKEKSMTKVSMKLNYAVSTLTEHINALEAELGVKLIERKGRGTAITKSGENFLVYAYRFMDIYSDACRAMSYFAGVEGLRIITSESVAIFIMPPVYTKFTKEYPDVEVSVSIGTPNIFCNMIRNDEADIAFRFAWEPLETDDLDSFEIFRERVVFVSHPRHRLAKRKNVTPADLDRESFIFPQKDSMYLEELNKIMKAEGRAIKSKLYVDSGSTIRECVKMGYGLTLLPYSIVRQDVENGQLTMLDWAGETPTAMVQAIVLKKEWTMPAIREFIDLSKAALVKM